MTALVRRLGCREYAAVWQDMRTFVDARTAATADEFWLLEHPPVFTLGLAGSRAHLLDPGTIPVIASDRGGQVTYHAPGQLIAYVLLDLKRLDLGPRELVRRLEGAVIATLATYDIGGERRPGAPGVYVDGEKIAALGLRIRHGCSYHGLALNVAPDLAPFTRINPCGYAGLKVTSLATLGVVCDLSAVMDRLEGALQHALYAPGAKVSPAADNALPS